ncbi:hypothetical protein PHISP_08593, partial [Aspergillus sp. HF37]
ARRHSKEHRRLRASADTIGGRAPDGRVAGRSMGPAPRWETAPVPDGRPATRTLDPPGTGRQPAKHGSCVWARLGADAERPPSPSH